MLAIDSSVLASKGLRALDAEVIEVGHEGKARHALEEAHKVRLAHAADARRFAHLDGVAAVFAQVTEQRAQPLQVLLLALIGFHRARVGRVLIHQQHQKHFEVGLHRQPAARRGCGNLRSGCAA